MEGHTPEEGTVGPSVRLVGGNRVVEFTIQDLVTWALSSGTRVLGCSGCKGCTA